VEWLCTGVHGTVPFARESCLSGQAMHGATLALVQGHARMLSNHPRSQDMFAGGFVLLVWCIMQIIVAKYSTTDLRLQSCTLIVQA
jgi:hypothetical protein